MCVRACFFNYLYSEIYNILINSIQSKLYYKQCNFLILIFLFTEFKFKILLKKHILNDLNYLMDEENL